MLVASMNPCPCGHFGEEGGSCTCTPAMIARYKARVSGPLMDRIDLKVNVRALDTSEFANGSKGESSMQIAERVAAARNLQLERFRNDGIFTNAQMSTALINKYCVLDNEVEAFLQKVASVYRLSARGYMRVLKVSRTIADMAGSENIKVSHISEASQYRFQENL